MPLNLSQWTWKPPSLVRDTEHSRPRHDAIATTELASLFPQWRREPPPRKPEEPSIILTSAASPELSPPLTATTPVTPYAAVLGDFQWAATHADDTTFAALTIKVCSSFRQRIILGEISPGDILVLSTEVWETLEARLPASLLGHRLSLSFCRAILSGLTASKVFSPTLLDASFWNAFLTRMSHLPADDTLGNLLVNVMAIMPATHRPAVEDSLLSVLGCFFSAWNRSRKAPEGRDIRRLQDIAVLGGLYEKQANVSALPTYLRQGRVISTALQAANPEETKRLLSAAHRLVVSQATAATRGQRSLRYGWLYMLAQMPHVNEDFLFDAAASLCSPSLAMPPMPVVEVSSLLLTQWASRGYLNSPREIYRSYRRHRGQRDEAALASLFLAVFNRGQGETRKGLYRSAWKFLSKLRQSDSAIRSLTFDARTGKLPVRMLEDLAHAANNHRIAICLRDLWSTQLRTRDQPQWYPGVFDKYAEAIVHDPVIPPKEIWRVLDINKLERQGTTFRGRRRRHANAFGWRRAAVVEKMAGAFATAPHLSNRAAVRHVSRSFAFLRLVRGNVPAPILQDIYKLVTRDLWEEKPGRTKRLLWFLRLVERVYGLELAWECRLALRRWRARLTKVWLSKGGGRRE